MTTTEMSAPPLTGSIFSEIQVRDIDTNNGLFKRLAGRAIPYNTSINLGPFSEEFSPGAFKRSIQNAARGLPLLLFHNDRGWPIGISSEWNDRRDALDGVWDLDTDAEAQRAAKMAYDGKLPYLSVRFQQVPGAFTFDNTREMPHFIRHEARMIETSLTATPAYIESTVTWVRSQPAAERQRLMREWESYLERIRHGPS